MSSNLKDRIHANWNVKEEVTVKEPKSKLEKIISFNKNLLQVSILHTFSIKFLPRIVSLKSQHNIAIVRHGNIVLQRMALEIPIE